MFPRRVERQQRQPLEAGTGLRFRYVRHSLHCLIPQGCLPWVEFKHAKSHEFGAIPPWPFNLWTQDDDDLCSEVLLDLKFQFPVALSVSFPHQQPESILLSKLSDSSSSPNSGIWPCSLPSFRCCHFLEQKVWATCVPPAPAKLSKKNLVEVNLNF